MLMPKGDLDKFMTTDGCGRSVDVSRGLEGGPPAGGGGSTGEEEGAARAIPAAPLRCSICAEPYNASSGHVCPKATARERFAAWLAGALPAVGNEDCVTKDDRERFADRLLDPGPDGGLARVLEAAGALKICDALKSVDPNISPCPMFSEIVAERDRLRQALESGVAVDIYEDRCANRGWNSVRPEYFRGGVKTGVFILREKAEAALKEGRGSHE